MKLSGALAQGQSIDLESPCMELWTNPPQSYCHFDVSPVKYSDSYCSADTFPSGTVQKPLLDDLENNSPHPWPGIRQNT